MAKSVIKYFTTGYLYNWMWFQKMLQHFLEITIKEMFDHRYFDEFHSSFTYLPTQSRASPSAAIISFASTSRSVPSNRILSIFLVA